MVNVVLSRPALTRLEKTPLHGFAFRGTQRHAKSDVRPPAAQVQQLAVKSDVKSDLLAALAKVSHTGVYGLEAGQKEAILSLVEQVEANNPLEAPTEHLEHCQGSWRLLYSTVTILVCSTALDCLLTDLAGHADFDILTIDMSKGACLCTHHDWFARPKGQACSLIAGPICVCCLYEAPLNFLRMVANICQGMKDIVWQDDLSGVAKFVNGRRRIKLGLKNVVNVGELTQHIDIATQHTKNIVEFDILLFGKLKGSLTIEAKYETVSPCRVAITLERAMLLPQQFQKLFEKNYDLLLAIFNPEGWLDITYVDAEHRIGRDDKGNVFVLERM